MADCRHFYSPSLVKNLSKTRNRNTNSLRKLGRYCNPEPQYTKKKLSKEMASDLAERNKLKPKCLGWVVTVEVDCDTEKQADFPESLNHWRCQVSQQVLVRWRGKAAGGFGSLYKEHWTPGSLTPALPRQPIAPRTSRAAKGGLLFGEKEPKRLKTGLSVSDP